MLSLMGQNNKTGNGRESHTIGQQTGQEPPFRFEFLPVRASLKPYLNSIYLFETSLPKIEETLPAVGGQLFLFFHGTGTISFPKTAPQALPKTYFMTPMSLAAQYQLKGPVSSIGAALTQLGWTAITGIRADIEHDTLVRSEDVLGKAILDLRKQCAKDLDAGLADYADIAERLSDLLEAAIRPVSERHQKTIRLTLEWLNSSVSPKVEDLYPLLPYSQRQAQRLVAQFFGLPPSKLVRRYRAQRAATLMTHAGDSAEADAELAEAFTDQSHMIREINRYTGKTPKKLGDPKDSLVSKSLDPKGYRPVKSMPGVFGDDDKDTQD